MTPLSNSKPQWFGYLIASFAIMQALFALVFYRHGVSADQWDLVPILQEFYSGGEWLNQVFSHHGDHFHSSAYLIMLPMAKLSNWSLLWELIAILLINTISYLLIYKSLLSQIVAQRGRHWLIATLLSSAIYFSTAHGGNLLWTWQLAVFTTILGLAICVTCLISTQRFIVTFISGLFGALIASFSFSCGFATWPVGALLILAKTELSIGQRLIACTVWCAFGLSVVALFLNSLDNTFSQEIELSIIGNLTFLLYYLGTPLAYFSREISLAAAFLGLSAFCYLVAKHLLVRQHPHQKLLYGATALALFAIISGLLISLGRAELGFSQARSFRYIAFSQFFWIGLLILTWINHSTVNQAQQVSKLMLKSASLTTGLLLMMSLLVAFNAQKIGRASIKSAAIDNAFSMKLASATEQQRDQLLNSQTYPDFETAKSYDDFLRKNVLNLYNSELNKNDQ